MTETKRILFYHGIFPAGGTERVTLDVANCISNYGYEVYVLAHHVTNNDFNHLTVIQIPEENIVQGQVDMVYMVEMIERLSIDVFVLPVSPFHDLLKYIKSRTHCKLIFALHSVPLWEVIYTLYEKKKRCGKSKIRLLLWHLIVYPKTMWARKYDPLVIDMHKEIYEIVDRYIVLCEGYRISLLKKMELSSVEKKMQVIHNSEAFPMSINLNKKKQVLFVGRMTYFDKRIDRLIDIWSLIFKKAPDWELILVGDGIERATLQQKVQHMNLKRIRFVGQSSNVSDYYQDASILCLTSTFEGWPLCLTEAQSYGVVPIAFDCAAGVHEILYPSGVNGILISPFQKKKYAHALLGLMNNPELLQTMRLNVICKSKEYSSEIVGNKWIELFNSVCR